jgi:putative hydrolase of the HAD superfamily
MENIIIFDGDDTLWSTMPLYDIAKARFAELVSDLISATDEAIRRLDEVDHANVAHLGFNTERFPGSMVQTYRLLCRERGTLPKADIEKQLLEAGRAVFTSAVVAYPDADACLARLTSRFRIILATKGDPTIQALRIEQSGFGHYFAEILILPEKTDRQFHDIVSAFGIAESGGWSVGNSVRSDINPALRAGLSAVLIPRSTWQYEDESLLPSPRTFVRDSLADAADLIIQMSG